MGCALTAEQALTAREPTRASAPRTDLDRLYAAALRRALQSDDLASRTRLQAQPRVVVLRDPWYLQPSALPGDVRAAFLLLPQAEIDDLVNWYGSFTYLRLTLYAARDSGALVAVEAVDAIAPGKGSTRSRVVSEYARRAGSWSYSRAASREIMAEYGVDPAAIVDERR